MVGGTFFKSQAERIQAKDSTTAEKLRASKTPRILEWWQRRGDSAHFWNSNSFSEAALFFT
ncbi:hypothetical protein OH492_24330 [Vibrio chagasii]|nr:hypothetical protein [Vibrio chagasii]